MQDGETVKLYSPKKYNRSIMKQKVQPDPQTWKLINGVNVKGEYDSYKEAIYYETRMVDSSATEGDEPKRRKIKVNRKYRDYLSSPPKIKRSKVNQIVDSESDDSSEPEEESSENEAPSPKLPTINQKTVTTKSLLESKCYNIDKSQVSETAFNSIMINKFFDSQGPKQLSVQNEDDANNVLSDDTPETEINPPTIINNAEFSASEPETSIRGTPTGSLLSSDQQTAVAQKYSDVAIKKIFMEQVYIKSKLIEVECKIDRILDKIVRAVPSAETNLLPAFPLKTIEEYKDFEKLITENEEAKLQFAAVIQRIGGNDMADCVKNIWKKVICNFVGKFLSWTGHKGNIKLENTVLLKTVREAVMLAFPRTTENDFKQKTMNFFQYASVRYSRQENNEDNNGD